MPRRAPANSDPDGAGRLRLGGTRWRRVRWCPATLEAGTSGRVERATQRVVERTQPDLVTRLYRASRADQMRAGAAFLVGHDRAQHPLDGGVQLAHHRMMLVQARAIDLDDDLRARGVERRALQVLQRVADHLAVEMAGARLALAAGERGLVRGAPGANHQPAEARRPRRAQRDRLGRSADDHPRPHPGRDLDLLVGQQRALRIGLGERQRHELRALAGQLQPQLARGILQHGAQLDELADQPSQPRVRRRPARRQRHRDARPRRVGRSLVAHVDVRVRVVAAGGKEPRLHASPVAHALQAPAALREPHVAQAAPEQPALAARVRQHAERSEPAIDRCGVHPDAVVAAAQLVAPVEQRGRAQLAHRALPARHERGVGRAEAQHDPSRRTAAERDRRVRVGHELGDDLHEVDPALREVLAEVAAVDASVADGGWIEQRGHRDDLNERRGRTAAARGRSIRTVREHLGPWPVAPVDSARAAGPTTTVRRTARRRPRSTTMRPSSASIIRSGASRAGACAARHWSSSSLLSEAQLRAEPEPRGLAGRAGRRT